MSVLKPSFLPLAAGACALALSGCATWKKHGVAVQPPKRVRVAVLPVQGDVKIPELAKIETISPEMKARKLSKADQQKLIAERMAENLSWMRGRLDERFDRTYIFEVVKDSEVSAALAGEGVAAGADFWALKPPQIERLAKGLKADVLLRTKLEGYGAVKPVWVALLVGSGFVEGIVQGVIVVAAVHNTWAAIGVGAEEALQETVEWVGGAYFFNKIFIPVILRGELLSGSDGKVIASKTAMEIFFRDQKALAAFPVKERGLTQTRLKVVAQKAVDDLGRYFEDKAFDNEGGAKWKLALD